MLLFIIRGRLPSLFLLSLHNFNLNFELSEFFSTNISPVSAIFQISKKFYLMFITMRGHTQTLISI